MEYHQFLQQKEQLSGNFGFAPLWMPDMLFDFQKSLVEWACMKGRAAIFADCGMGKTFMQLVWAENIIRKTNKKVIVFPDGGIIKLSNLKTKENKTES